VHIGALTKINKIKKISFASYSKQITPSKASSKYKSNPVDTLID